MRVYVSCLFGFVMACSARGDDAVSGDQHPAAAGGAAPIARDNAGAVTGGKAASTGENQPGPAAAGVGAGAKAAGGAVAAPQGGSGANTAGTGGAAADAAVPQASAADSGNGPAQGGAGAASAPTPSEPIAGGPSTPAAGSGGADAPALIGVGSCCTAHDTPGCGNADLQVCVCEQLPSCCTDKWDAACTFIVTQKHCQPGIRECVCGSASDQWGQAQCCAQRWSNTCDEVAETKCGAEPGCF